MSEKYVRVDYGSHKAEYKMLLVGGKKISAEEYIAICEKDPARECDVYKVIKSWAEEYVELSNEPRAFSCHEYFYTSHDDTAIRFCFYDECGTLLWHDEIEDIGGAAAELYAAFLLKLYPVPVENIKYYIIGSGESDRYGGLYNFLNRLNPNGNN